ncbi:MAG: pyruvate carboxylase subunit B [Ruminococcaceae bacterium]|nr:pyruvate carboxylase subunit B [Oscillospiraceae bacterium]
MLGFTETVLRDANQSLAATRMSSSDFEEILEKIDQAGYYSVECWGGATFDSCIRYLKEDPWERLRLMRKRMPNTKLQMLLRGQNLLGYTHYPTQIVRDFIEASIKNGIDIIRIFDALNDLDNIKDAVQATLDFGGHPSCALCYTVSPVHSVEKFVELAVEMEKLGAMSICIKDMSGCLMPGKAYELVSKLKAALKVPVILHTHSSSGLAPMTCLKAIEAGVDVIDTAVSCFSGGTSQAPTETMALIAEENGIETGLDIACVSQINTHFKTVFDRLFSENIITYRSMQTNTESLISQIPGGMYSNLLSQMNSLGIMDKLSEVVQEVPQVRKDLGYPPLVTPISQMVGTQAVANVLAGERYKTVINEIKAYVCGDYGRAPSEIDPEVHRLVMENNASAKKPNNDYLNEKEKRLAQGCSTEDMLTYVLFPQLAEKFFAPQEEYPEDGFRYTCAEHNEKEPIGTPISLNEIGDEALVAMKVILAAFTKSDVQEIQIQRVFKR